MSEHRTYHEIRKQHHAEEGDYTLLRGDKQKVRERLNQWTTDYVLEQYVTETDQLIGILDGSIAEDMAIPIRDPEIGENEPINPDTVVWLDKSARPVAWFVDAFWEQFAQDGAKKPEDEYLNIDRINWFVHTGHDETQAKWRLGPEDFDISKVDPERIAGLRALFVEGDLDKETWQEQVWDMPTRFDGKSLLIVDEVMNRGGTLSIASQLLKAAIPDAKVSATYFWHTNRYAMNKSSAERENQQMESAPVWYDNINPMGRGIGEVSLSYWRRQYETEPTQENLKRTLAAFALSAPHHDPETFELQNDPRADMLKQDIAYLSYAVAEGDVIRRPSPYREDYFDIFEQQGLTREEAKAFIQGRK
jgi:hypothetical protein